MRGPAAVEIATCIAFALAGAGTRFALVDVQTRLQIAAFWAIALAVAFRRWWRSRRWTLAFLANGVAATIAIVATRTALEGLPRPLLHLLQHMHG